MLRGKLKSILHYDDNINNQAFLSPKSSTRLKILPHMKILRTFVLILQA
jgi:hypothetical protein